MAKKDKIDKKEGSDIKYQILGYLSIAVIILSIATFGLRMTGYVAYGTVNLTIEPSAAYNFSSYFIDFKSGKVTDGFASGNVTSRGTAVQCNWTAPTNGFVIENIGNRDLNISFKSVKNATEFLGNGANYLYNITNLEAGSCNNYSSLDAWYEINSTSPGHVICNLSLDNDHDTIRMDIRLVIPSDVAPGYRVDNVTATVTAI
ncbi:MAG: hypothetical protein ACP5OG_02410 [Candidatus Nanoarchaeia archaeon]